MIWLLVAAAIHAAFALAELFPWPQPILLGIASAKLPDLGHGRQWTPAQQPIVATIVHNAGIYNAILAGGMLWAAWEGEPGRDTGRVLLLGAAAAGIFGTATLRSLPTAIQAVVGIAGFIMLR